MQLELSKGKLRARVQSFGGELVSLCDEKGTEYIWGGESPYWPGQNPVLFPIVGKLRDGRIRFEGREYEMTQHGFARRMDFQLIESSVEHAVFELCESPETLEKYPYRFSLRLCHRLLESGFSTAFTVENRDNKPMPFCIGAHSGFRCPMHEGEKFEDYMIVFDRPETVDKILLTKDALISPSAREPMLRSENSFALDYDVFERIDTVILEGLCSKGVCLVHKDSKQGLRMEFDGFPMFAIWTQGAKKAPFICLEPWHGCSAVENESGDFTDKAHCIVLEPGESKALEYKVSILQGGNEV